MDTFGDRLKEERERLSLTQTAFGELGGVAKLAQINYEKNSRRPDVDYLMNVSQAGVDVLYLITGMRNENVATTPIELAMLRNCRLMPSREIQEVVLRNMAQLREALEGME